MTTGPQRPQGARQRRGAPTRATRRWLMLGGFALALLVGIGIVAANSGGDDDSGDEDTTSAGADAPAGVETFDVPTRNHVQTTVDYPQAPPVGGDHAPVWQDCGFYEEPIFPETGVHSLEHGAVWITYDPDAPQDVIAGVRDLASQPYVVASPWVDGELGAPVVLSAWGAQLRLDTLPSPEATEFLRTYRQALSAPEPGAPCTGGYPDPR